MTKRILVQLSGSIACYKTCELISTLRKKGHEVQVVATKSALKFVGITTLEALSGRSVYYDGFESGHLLSHIELAKWADLAILCPATANTIAKLAHGIADDVVGNLFLAINFGIPYLLAPAMNTQMYLHPTRQANIKLLQKLGVIVLPTGKGSLACQDVGEGRLLEPVQINRYIDSALENVHHIQQNQRQKPLPVLITYGAISEAVDGVRLLTNSSTGVTGSFLVDYFQSHFVPVHVIRSKSSQPPILNGVEEDVVVYFQELQDALIERLKRHKYQAVIHLAAVSDYKPVGIKASQEEENLVSLDQKLSSDMDSFSLLMKKNIKLVDHLKEWSVDPNTIMIAFKLTQTSDESIQYQNVCALVNRADVDWVVHNDLIDKNNQHHQFAVYRKTQLYQSHLTIENLGKTLISVIKEDDYVTNPRCGE